MLQNNIGKIEKLIRKRNLIEIVLIVIFIAQFCMTIYFNLALLANHMGYDSSWSYLKAALIWNEKSLNSDIWTDQTSVFLDSSMILASLLYGITGKLFISYGIANIIVLSLSLLCMASILQLLGISSVKAKWFSYNLMICPYLSNGFNIANDLGYFNDMLSGPAFYSLRALIVLLIVREYLYIKRYNRISWQGLITLLLCALAGASSGIFIIVMIFLPFIVYIVEEVLLENSFKALFKLDSLYAYIGIIFVLLGKLFAKLVLNISAIDASRTWTTVEKVFINFGAPIQGFMKLIGVLPIVEADVNVLSKRGIITVFPIMIFLVIIISIAYAINIMKKDILTANGNILFLVNIIVINYLVFGSFNVQYGSVLFEERYLISTFMIIIILVAFYIQNLNLKSIFSTLLAVTLLLCLLANDIVSDVEYIETTNDAWQMNEIVKTIDSQDASLVYLWGDELLILGRSLRAYDLDHIYKCITNSGQYLHWGDYKYYEDNPEYSGSTLLIVSNGNDIVPESYKDSYKLIKTLQNVSILICNNNPIDRASGITNDTSVDFPSSSGMCTQFGVFDGNSFISDGTEGFIMWGPNVETQNGTYSFSIDYSYISGSSATFDVAIDSGKTELGAINLLPSETSMTIRNITLEDGHTLEYRVYTESGTSIKIDKITITKE